MVAPNRLLPVLCLLSLLWATACSTDGVLRTVLGTSGGVYRSRDSGRTWNRVGLAGMTVSLLVAHPSRPNVIYAVGDERLYSSMDGGDHWQLMASDLPEAAVMALAASPLQADVIYAASNGHGLFRSTDAGLHWQRTGPEETVTFVWVDPDSGQRILAGSFLFLYESLDGGRTWQQRNGPASGIFSWVVDPQATAVVYAGGETGVFRSEDVGRTWTAIRSKARGKARHTNVVAVAPSAASESGSVLAGTLDGVYRSLDGGDTWRKTGLKGSYILLVVDPRDPRRLFAASRFAVSTDGGSSWATRSDPGGRFGLLSIVVDPHQPDVLFAGTIDAAGL